MEYEVITKMGWNVLCLRQQFFKIWGRFKKTSYFRLLTICFKKRTTHSISHMFPLFLFLSLPLFSSVLNLRAFLLTSSLDTMPSGKSTQSSPRKKRSSTSEVKRFVSYLEVNRVHTLHWFIVAAQRNLARSPRLHVGSSMSLSYLQIYILLIHSCVLLARKNMPSLRIRKRTSYLPAQCKAQGLDAVREYILQGPIPAVDNTHEQT